MKDLQDILIKPLVTEKSSTFLSENKYFFKVQSDANKIEIRLAVEQLFNVKVAKVNTISVQGRKRQYGRIQGKTKDWKKAVVTLKEGQIDLGQVKKNS